MSAYVYWSSAYFATTAILYLWGYWSVFHINVLEYVGLTDIAKTAAYPIASTFVFLALGAVLGEVIFPHGMFPPGGGASSPISITLRRHVRSIAAVYAVGTVLLFFLGPPEKWRILPILVAIPVSFVIKERGMLSAVLPSDSVRTVILFLLVTLPPFAYGHGQLKALDIRNGTAFTYSVGAIEGLFIAAHASPQERPRYLGRAGEHMFFFSPPDGSVLVTTLAHIKAVQLKVYEAQPASQPVPTRSPAASQAGPAASGH